MFKRGDVVQGVAMHDDKVYLFVSANEAITIKGDTAYGHKLKPSLFCLQLYTGPTYYDYAGRRYVPSGEWRQVLKGENFRTPSHVVGISRVGTAARNFDSNGDTEDHGCHAILLPVPDLPEEHPGRPLTTDDLMLVLSGEKITVECHACGCDKGGGITGDLYAETDDPEDDELDGSMLYFHHTNNPKGAGNYQLASFKDGYIVFADGVEGNIYIVGEA